MKTYEISEPIGSTPLVRLKNYSLNRELAAAILVKIEFSNLFKYTWLMLDVTILL
ncbi:MULTISPECIES: hypothetical protein [unclassified Ruminococcus]|uniref:hypothetical protein n=1 Tax=unclassified Ruminococcus TaxID=2608920 RepID=UPI00210B4DCA|nr:MULTISPECIES: hypothetical protein [unclassified Ruminococcus]MCQ4023272.1 hypothetical protein [Ruminococcus sp. zg-924]MCQ4115058.1 hypothetical protein [Ruminococcus sp. zg-921]